jgi:hypothetical protein
MSSWKRRCDPDTLIREILEQHKTYHVPVAGVEEVALQQLLSFYLEKAIAAQHLYLRVEPVKPGSVEKDARIRSMTPYQRERKIVVLDGDTLFLDEATAFPRGEKHLLDCYAYQPRVWQIPMPDSFVEDQQEELNEYLKAVNG